MPQSQKWNVYCFLLDRSKTFFRFTSSFSFLNSTSYREKYDSFKILKYFESQKRKKRFHFRAKNYWHLKVKESFFKIDRLSSIQRYFLKCTSEKNDGRTRKEELAPTASNNSRVRTSIMYVDYQKRSQSGY